MELYITILHAILPSLYYWVCIYLSRRDTCIHVHVNQIKSNQIYFSTTFNITFMCTLLHYYNLKFISIMIVNV